MIHLYRFLVEKIDEKKGVETDFWGVLPGREQAEQAEHEEQVPARGHAELPVRGPEPAELAGKDTNE